MSTIAHLINGEIVFRSGRTTPVFNPSMGEAIRQVELADAATIQLAIDSAKAAFPAWRNTPPAKRAQVMFRFKQLLEANKDKAIEIQSEEVYERYMKYLRGCEFYFTDEVLDVSLVTYLKSNAA